MSEYPKRQKTDHAESSEINVSFPNLHSACTFKFEQMFRHIYCIFREFHKLETISLFNKWIRTLNNTFIKNTNQFYLVECDLAADTLKWDYNYHVEIICSVFVVLVAKLYMDEIVCRHFRNIQSDYVNCLKTLRKMDIITDKEFKISFEFLIFDNNMQSALSITRNDTVDRTPIYYHQNIKELLYDMALVEKKVIKHLDWKLFNPIYLTPLGDVEKNLSKNQRKRSERHFEHSKANVKRGPSDHTMGWKECSGQIDLLFPGKKRIRQFSQEDQIRCSNVGVWSTDSR
jgi:hypothetical protein